MHLLASTQMNTVSKETLVMDMKDAFTLRGFSVSNGQVEGRIVRLGVDDATVEFPGFEFLPRLSEVLDNIQMVSGRVSFSAKRATISGMVSTGSSYLCHLELQEVARQPAHMGETWRVSELKGVLHRLLTDWQDVCQVDNDYRVVVSNIENFFANLRSWINGFELMLVKGDQSSRDSIERQIAEVTVASMEPHLNALFERFEFVAASIPEDLAPRHSKYVRMHLHPYLLCSPFMWRIFRKPLGYAGDYEMVGMILRDHHEGPSLYARILNRWILSQVLAQAHRNRVEFLAAKLLEESTGYSESSKVFRVFNLGCGPAREVALFLQNRLRRSVVDFTLVDFNEETLEVAASTLLDSNGRAARQARIRFVKRSAAQVIRSAAREFEGGYNMIYCAGLFDYLSDDVCGLLLKAFYDMLAPKGLLLVTNVQLPNPMHGVMTHIFDWHLECRDASDMRQLWRSTGLPVSPVVSVDGTGANVFLEARKDVDNV